MKNNTPVYIALDADMTLSLANLWKLKHEGTGFIERTDINPNMHPAINEFGFCMRIIKYIERGQIIPYFTNICFIESTGILKHKAGYPISQANIDALHFINTFGVRRKPKNTEQAEQETLGEIEKLAESYTNIYVGRTGRRLPQPLKSVLDLQSQCYRPSSDAQSFAESAYYGLHFLTYNTRDLVYRSVSTDKARSNGVAEINISKNIYNFEKVPTYIYYIKSRLDEVKTLEDYNHFIEYISALSDRNFFNQDYSFYIHELTLLKSQFTNMEELKRSQEMNKILQGLIYCLKKDTTPMPLSFTDFMQKFGAGNFEFKNLIFPKAKTHEFVAYKDVLSKEFIDQFDMAEQQLDSDLQQD